ncbi:unnamed protein product [Ilex paraguariensis]|uniref:Uncharacterized protein n=1 Tax=Ilex paraguariensis TaxID=185542 RepID=A0ABC8UL90_9AQUA
MAFRGKWKIQYLVVQLRLTQKIGSSQSVSTIRLSITFSPRHSEQATGNLLKSSKPVAVSSGDSYAGEKESQEERLEESLEWKKDGRRGERKKRRKGKENESSIRKLQFSSSESDAESKCNGLRVDAVSIRSKIMQEKKLSLNVLMPLEEIQEGILKHTTGKTAIFS